MRTIAFAGCGSRNFVTLMVVAMLAACATPATHEGMIADRYDIARQHAKSVNVSTSGGGETSSVGKPQCPSSMASVSA